MNEELIKYLNQKLKLSKYKNSDEMSTFLAGFQKYLNGNYSKRSVSGTGGRTLDTIKKNTEDFCSFLETIGCSEEQIIHVIEKAPDLMNLDVNKLYQKYLILGMLPMCNDDENYRLKHIVSKPQDLRTSEETMYDRICFASSVGYPMEKLTWNMVIHATESEYAKIFIKSSYAKNYKIFESVEEYKKRTKYFLSPEAISDLKKLDCNKEVVERYEQNQEPRL